MPEQIENRMVIDSEWDEVEYGVKRNSIRLSREREAYLLAEMTGDYGFSGEEEI